MAKKVKKGLKTGLNVMTLGMSNKISKYLNPKIPQAADAPDPAPIPDDEAALIANRRKLAMRSKGGRSSTLLSDSNKLG